MFWWMLQFMAARGNVPPFYTDPDTALDIYSAYGFATPHQGAFPATLLGFANGSWRPWDPFTRSFK